MRRMRLPPPKPSTLTAHGKKKFRNGTLPAMATASARLVSTPSVEVMNEHEKPRRERGPKRSRSHDRDQEEPFQSERSTTHVIGNQKVCPITWKRRPAIFLLLIVPTAQAVWNRPHALVKPYADIASSLMWSQVYAPQEKGASSWLHMQHSSGTGSPKTNLKTCCARVGQDMPDNTKLEGCARAPYYARSACASTRSDVFTQRCSLAATLTCFGLCWQNALWSSAGQDKLDITTSDRSKRSHAPCHTRSACANTRHNAAIHEHAARKFATLGRRCGNMMACPIGHDNQDYKLRPPALRARHPHRVRPCRRGC